MKTRIVLVGLVAVLGCEEHVPTTDEKQSREQAKALEQAHEQIGMPAISDFAEKRMMKDLYEARDNRSRRTRTWSTR